MKRFVQLGLLAFAAMVVYNLIRRQRRHVPMPAGAPFEPAPVPRAPTPVAVPQTEAADDLTRVRGIGPVYAGRLRDAAVTSFRGLAEADTASLAAELEVSAEVVSDWQAQARDLQS